MSFDATRNPETSSGPEEASGGTPGRRTRAQALIGNGRTGSVSTGSSSSSSTAAPSPAAIGGDDPFGFHLQDARGGGARGGKGKLLNVRPEDAGGAAAGGAQGAVGGAQGAVGGPGAGAANAPAPAPGQHPPNAPSPAQPPRPLAVRNGPAQAPIDSGDDVGMSIAITVTSSSGVDADMARIQDAEQVSDSKNHTGSCTALPPGPGGVSGFMPGYPIPDDQHGWSRAQVIDLADNHGGNGSLDFDQLDIYTDAAAGVPNPVAIPSSGYVITRTITKGQGTNLVLRTEKRPAAVAVAGFNSAAGPSGVQGDNVTIRP